MTEKDNELTHEIMDDQMVQPQATSEKLLGEKLLENPPRESIELLRQFFNAGLFGV